MQLTIEVDHEEDGRWIAEVMSLPGVMGSGQTREEAVARVQILARRVLAERGEACEVTFEVADATRSRIADLIGFIDTGIPDLGSNHEEHLRRMFHRGRSN